ncbi:MAG: hypothetical protein QM529_00165 [Hydrotalea sp.]|nr:hypothetical protein [Hydrotalea sp.]
MLSARMRHKYNFNHAEQAIEKAKSNLSDENLIEAFCEIQAWGGKDAWRHKGKWMNTKTLATYKQLINAIANVLNHNGYYNYASILPPEIKINGLAISYHSKHLKFIDNNFIVYDSYISQKIGDKGETLNGYKFFHQWCLKKAKKENVMIHELEEAIWEKIFETNSSPRYECPRDTLKKQIDEFRKAVGL